MASITYKPAPGDAEQVTWAGLTLKAGESVETDNPAVLAKAKNNPFFEVSASKEEERQAEIVGGYADANTGEPVELVRLPRTISYGVTAAGPTGPVPPSRATQGSTAAGGAPSTAPAAPDNFEEIYGAPQDQVATGEYEGAPQYKGPEGTEGGQSRRGRPPKSRE